MKRKIILIISIILALILVFIIINITFKSNEKTKEEKSTCKLVALTITDNGTEIEIEVNNKSNKNKKIRTLVIDLYDSSNKKIQTIKQEENSILKAKESKTFKITNNKRYLSANELECYVYEIKK